MSAQDAYDRARQEVGFGSEVKERTSNKPDKPQPEISNEVSGRKLQYIGDWDGALDDPSVRLYGTYKELTDAGVKDANHPIQDAAMRNILGYSKASAPAIQADGPSHAIGSEHYHLTQDQRRATTGGTYGAERKIGMDSLERRLHLSESEMQEFGSYIDSYFIDKLGLSSDSTTRIPGNRHGIK